MIHLLLTGTPKSHSMCAKGHEALEVDAPNLKGKVQSVSFR